MVDTQIQPNSRPIDEILAPSAVNITSTSIQLGDVFARTIFVSTFPRFVNVGWFSSIINLDRKFDISIFLHPKDTGIVLKQLRTQLGRLQAQEIEEQTDGKVRNPLLEIAISDVESLRDRLQQGAERFFELGVYITIYGKSESELKETEVTMREILDAHLVSIRKTTFRMEDGFRSTLPISKDLVDVHTSANTNPISSLFPFASYDLTSDEGIMYGINSHNNSLVLFDRFSLENANTVIFGKSGGGKSFAVKLEILRSMIFGTQIFVIDPENEYEALAQAVGGTSVDVSVSSPQHINPFDIPPVEKGHSFQDSLRSHIAYLIGFFKLLLKEITSDEEAMLDEAIRQTYASKDIREETINNDISAPLLSDFQIILQGMAGGEAIANRINRYTEGSFAGFLNNPTNVSLNNQIVVFNIKNMEEELRPVAMYLVLNYIWSRVRVKLRKRILVIDEAWWLMRFKFSGEFMLNIAKRARKYYLGLTTISQDISDFMSAEYGRPVITNSSLQLLLKQSPADIDNVQKTFRLTDSEKNFLLQAPIGQGLFFAGTNHVALQVVASPAEKELVTSNPQELLDIKEAQEMLNQNS